MTWRRRGRGSLRSRAVPPIWTVPADTRSRRRCSTRSGQCMRESNANLGGAFADVGGGGPGDDARPSRPPRSSPAAPPDGVAFGANMTRSTSCSPTPWRARSSPVTRSWSRAGPRREVAPWLVVAADHGLVGAAPPIRTGDVTLDHDAVEALIGERTRVVAFTLASNAVGSVTDPAPHSRRCARAPARWPGQSGTPRPAPAAARRGDWGLDVMLCSPYKFSARIWAWPRSARPGRVAAGRARAPSRRERRPGTASRRARCHTRRWLGTVAAVDYLRSLATARSTCAFERIGAHEDALARRSSRRCLSRSSSTASAASRAARPPSASTCPAAHRARWPSGWASAVCTCGTATNRRLEPPMRALGLSESGGAVRAGFLHYTSEEEVDRLVEELGRALGGASGRASASSPPAGLHSSRRTVRWPPPRTVIVFQPVRCPGRAMMMEILAPARRLPFSPAERQGRGLLGQSACGTCHEGSRSRCT